MYTVARFGCSWKLILPILRELGGDDSKATSLHTENTSQHILCLIHPRNPAGSEMSEINPCGRSGAAQYPQDQIWTEKGALCLGTTQIPTLLLPAIRIQGFSFPQEHRSQAGWRGIFSSQNVTPPNCSGEQRQAPERSQLLTSQCKNEFPFPLCLFWQFHFIFPGIQSANHPSGSPCSGNEGISHLPFHSLFPLCCHYWCCSLWTAWKCFSFTQKPPRSTDISTDTHRKSSCVFLLNWGTSKRNLYPRWQKKLGRILGLAPFSCLSHLSQVPGKV